MRRPRRLGRRLRAFKGMDVQGRLAAFESPTLVLAGKLDASCTPQIMKALAGRIPAATYQHPRRHLPGTARHPAQETGSPAAPTKTVSNSSRMSDSARQCDSCHNLSSIW